MQDSSILAPDARETHLLDYWRIIVRGRWTIGAVFVVILTLVAIGTFTQKPVYRATAKVEITPQARKVSPVADVAELGTGSFGWFAEERYFNTQYEIMKSRDVAQRVFDKLDLYHHPTFKKSNDPVGLFTKMIEVDPVKDTGIVEISVEGVNPEEVAAWANTVAESYVQRNLDQAIEATSRAVKSLLNEVAPLREKLEDTQRSSYQFAERANLFVPENQQKMTNERLSTLQTELTQTQVKRAEMQSLLHRVEAQGSEPDSYASIPLIGNDPVIQDLYKEKAGLEREYEKLLVTYKDKHVRVLEKQKEIDNLVQKIKTEAQRIIGQFRNELALLNDQEAKLEKALEDTRTESLRLNQKASDYEFVRGEATETKRIYDLISVRVKEIGLSSSLLNNNLSVLDAAPVPKFPVKPRKVFNLATGAMLGLLVGVGLVFLLDYINNTIRTAEDIEQYLKLNLLAIVPKQTDHTESAVKEAYQTLRTSLLFSRKSRSANAVLITSAGPQEGKSSTVVNVARTVAKSGERVVVVDCDLRRPAIQERLHLQREGGLTNYMLGSNGDDLAAYIKSTDEPNLFAITSGPLPPNPADVFGHERFRDMLQQLRQKFDWVFIDSPPVASLADAIILASMADMVALVVKHNENDREVIRRCVTSLRKINPNVVGAVLNHIDLDRSHYTDYYYMGYYEYGGTPDKKSRRGRKAVPSAPVALNDVKDRISRSAGEAS